MLNAKIDNSEKDPPVIALKKLRIPTKAIMAQRTPPTIKNISALEQIALSWYLECRALRLSLNSRYSTCDALSCAERYAVVDNLLVITASIQATSKWQ